MSTRPMYETRCDDLPISVYETNQEMGAAAAEIAASIINQAIQARGEANIILATGNSQLTFLAGLRAAPGISWSQVNVFHMDEYVGIDPAHPASFPQFLRKHFLSYIHPKAFYPVSGAAANIEDICRNYAELLRKHPLDLTAMGIGENGHIAFNDPPFADFNDPAWVKPVELDRQSRQQQVNEGHFASLEQVPTHAITVTIPALLAAKRVLCIVPEARKAEAVARTLNGPITPDCPASILRRTGHAHLLLDKDAAGTWRSG